MRAAALGATGPLAPSGAGCATDEAVDRDLGTTGEGIGRGADHAAGEVDRGDAN